MPKIRSLPAFEPSCTATRRRAWSAVALVAGSCALTSPWCQAAPLPAPGAPLADDALAQNGALRVGLTSNTQIVYRPKPWLPPGPQADAGAPPQESLGLEFRATKPGQSTRNLFRVQLSSDSVLQFRPRGGGLTVNYGAQF